MKNILIDLHTHTNVSDGEFSPSELYEQIKKEARDAKVVWSITDHDSVDAYKELKNIIDEKVKIITGCEFCFKYNTRLREMLGYNINITKAKTFLDNLYTHKLRIESQQIILEKFKEKCRNMGLKFDENIKISVGKKSEAYGLMMRSVRSIPENYEKGIDIGISFFRKHFSNPDSPFYVSNATVEPNLEDIVKLIHSFDGLCFVAHPFEYLDNNEKTLQFLTDCVNAGVDGIEIMHNSINEERLKILTEFVTQNNLLISGGSDFHGEKVKKGIYLFSGKNNVKVDFNDLSWAKLKNFNEI